MKVSTWIQIGKRGAIWKSLDLDPNRNVSGTQGQIVEVREKDASLMWWCDLTLVDVGRVGLLAGLGALLLLASGGGLLAGILLLSWSLSSWSLGGWLLLGGALWWHFD